MYILYILKCLNHLKCIDNVLYAFKNNHVFASFRILFSTFFINNTFNHWSSEIPKDTIKSLSCIFGTTKDMREDLQLFIAV